MRRRKLSKGPGHMREGERRQTGKHFEGYDSPLTNNVAIP